MKIVKTFEQYVVTLDDTKEELQQIPTEDVVDELDQMKQTLSIEYKDNYE